MLPGTVVVAGDLRADESFFFVESLSRGVGGLDGEHDIPLRPALVQHTQELTADPLPASVPGDGDVDDARVAAVAVGDEVDDDLAGMGDPCDQESGRGQ